MASIKKYLSVISITIVILSCSSASKLRRAEKLIKKAEELGAVWHVDSVSKEILVPVPQVSTDTVLKVKVGDTVIVEKDRLKVVIKRLAGDTVRIEAACKADTVRTRVTTTITKTIEAKGKIRWYHLGLAFLVGAIVGRFVIRLLI